MVKMEALRPYLVLAAVFSLHALDCKNVQGLTCVNDFINNVTCTLNSPSVDDCIIHGYKKIRFRKDGMTQARIISRSCEVKQHRNALPGCNFVFENRNFTFFERMPNISMKCNGTLVEHLQNYEPENHIKMHPPGLPNVSLTDKEIVIDWRPGSPRSVLLEAFDYQVQIQKSDPMTKDVKIIPTTKAQFRIAAEMLKDKHQVRVKVKPAQKEQSQWSEWSPSASLVGPRSENTEWNLSQMLIIVAVLTILVVMIVMTLVFYKCSIGLRVAKVKPVPNPSKYFRTLDGSKLKEWLNPNCAESLHTAQSVDRISPVEVCESQLGSNSAPQPPSNTQASGCSDDNRLVENSSSSSSCFSNLGYFVSESSSSSVQTEPNPVYFAYKDDLHILHKAHNPKLHLFLPPSLSKSPSCDSLKRGTQSPDSGFCMERDVLDVEEDQQNLNGEQVSGHRSSSHLSLPLHLPVKRSSPSTPSQISSDSAQMHTPVLAANVSATGWPVACATYRPSSMPMESSKAGYFILQEIQTTSSNASI
ncbi:interleukin-2 receptor subunit beta isoform X2 [Syngnathus acus]|uniref:interleukin-2 receptor subunit beta isoform X2 n=1 Tax=Syngnathus acus TaxID=161584 RepID=UPI0018862B5D|nr:interleukin-2 receptor subunit beta isoform X2 [Syngnathus acus]